MLRARMSAVLLSCTLLTVACSGDGSSPMSPDAMQQTATATMATRQIILLKQGKSATTMATHVQALGGNIQRTHESIGVLMADHLDPTAIAALRLHPDVAAVVADRYVRWLPTKRIVRQGPATKRTVSLSKTDPTTAEFYAEFQWNIRVIHANAVYRLTRKGVHKRVCILDTGVDYTHIDLAGKVNQSVSTSLVASEPGIEDLDFHGTFVSSMVATNGIGIASVAPSAELCMVKVLDHTGSGTFSDAISGTIYAADVSADVINMSFGAMFLKSDSGVAQLREAFQRAVNYATNQGIVVAVAAGNDAVNLAKSDSIEIPAQLNNVISTGAIAPIDQMNFLNTASYTNFGFPAVQVFAPGGDQIPGDSLADLIIGACSSFSITLPFSCADKESYVFGAGTSFASPHVAGEAAVLQSDFDTPTTRRPIDTEPVRHCILISAAEPNFIRPDPVYGYGVIDMITARDCFNTI